MERFEVCWVGWFEGNHRAWGMVECMDMEMRKRIEVFESSWGMK